MKSVYLGSSVQDLANLAEKSLPPIDNNTRLVLYFRSAQQILMQANMYKRDGDFEKAYIHMMKYSILILEKLPKHTQYALNLPELYKEKETAKKMVLKLLDDLEGMKLVLKKLYADEEAQKKKQAEEQAAQEQEKERLRQQEELEREEQAARIRAEQEEQRRKEEEQQREWQMELFARQQLLSNNNNPNNNAAGNATPNDNNNNILIPTPTSSTVTAAPPPFGANGNSNGNGNGFDVDPLLAPMQALQLQQQLGNNLMSSPSLPQPPFQPMPDGSSASEPQVLPQDFFLQQQQQQQLMQQQQQQQQQYLQDMAPPSASSPTMPTSPSPSGSTDSATMTMLPPQPSAPPAPPSVLSPDFLTPQEPPPPRSPSIQPTGQPLVDIPKDIYAPPPPETFHNLASLGPTSFTTEKTQGRSSEYTPSGKSSVAYPDLDQRDPPPPRSNNTATTNPYPKYTPPPNITNPTLPPSTRFANPALPPSPAFPAVAAYQHFPPSPPIQAAQHPGPYAPPPHFMPPTYVPAVHSRPPSITAPNPIFPPPQQPPPQYKHAPATTRPAPPAANAPPSSRPPQPAPATTRKVTPLGNIPSLATTKDPEASPASFLPPAEKPKNTNGLRKMVVYGEMFTAFMKVANANTQRKIETCAILSGTLLKDVFYVTTMIVPKQEGTRDTCVTKNEEELFEYQMSNDLLTLGWIHTHPTQDCFLSSVDLHTHCTYQLLLPEAIAVVISPMFNPNLGVFRVSDPPGMGIIQNCNQRGFHQHADTKGKSLYSLCDHVDVIWGSNKFKVVDLR